MKPKLLIWCDFLVPTGFGNVAKNLFKDLHQYYDVSIVAINYLGNTKYDTSKYFVYAAQHSDMLNRKNLINIVKTEQPEFIILFQDIFNISEVIINIKKASPKSKIIGYYPIDANTFSNTWISTVEALDVNITYTNWAVDIIKNAAQTEKDIKYLYHGVDTNTFYPYSTEKIKALRAENNWTNKFVFVNVNRFQPRKAISLSLRAFYLFLKGYKVCKCGNYYGLDKNICDVNGCDKSNVIAEVPGITDTYYYLHMNSAEPTMGGGITNTLQHHAMMVGFTDKEYGTYLGINATPIYENLIPDSYINEIYNAANVNLSTTNGEGFGLSLIESMATGTLSIAPNNSAIPEVLKGTGHLVNNKAVYAHPFDNGFFRPVVDVPSLVDKMTLEYIKWKDRGVDKYVDTELLDVVRKYYNWEEIRKKLLEYINL